MRGKEFSRVKWLNARCLGMVYVYLKFQMSWEASPSDGKSLSMRWTRKRCCRCGLRWRDMKRRGGSGRRSQRLVHDPQVGVVSVSGRPCIKISKRLFSILLFLSLVSSKFNFSQFRIHFYMSIRAIEFYSGIGAYLDQLLLGILSQSFKGGLHRALSLSNVDATVIRAFDWDQTACQVYQANYGNIIRKVKLPFHSISLLHW